MEPRPRRRRCARCSRGATCACASTSDERPSIRARSTAPVRWVHSSDLADPTPFLSEGLVLLTTGTQFQRRRRRPGRLSRAYVRRLAARGVVGLGFGTEVVRDGIPPALADACRDERMPLFEVPYRTPFIAVARANAEAIAARGLRAPQLGARRAARDRARGAAAGRTRRDARRAGPPARHLGRACSTPPARSCASIPRRRLDAETARRACAPRWTRAAPRARAPDRRCASATRRSRCRPSAAAATCAGSSRSPRATSTRRGAGS